MMRFGSGAVVVIGVLILIYSLLVVRKKEMIAPGETVSETKE